jgi:hypothetical protein
MKVNCMMKKQEIRAGVMSGYGGERLQLSELDDGEPSVVPDEDGEVVDEDESLLNFGIAVTRCGWQLKGGAAFVLSTTKDCVLRKMTLRSCWKFVIKILRLHEIFEVGKRSQGARGTGESN